MNQTGTHVNRDLLLKEMADLARSIQVQNPGGAQMIEKLSLHVPMNRLDGFVVYLTERIKSGNPITLDLLMDNLIHNGCVELWGARLKIQSKQSLITIAEEILVHQEYHLISDHAQPRVIDAGANIGLATYYVRRMCKAAEVICFEPNPDTFAVLQENTSVNRWDNVVLHQAAVAPEDGEADFYVMSEATLAASLDPRNKNNVSEKVNVETRDLRPFLQDPVALLKLDIEGSEADVLEACAEDLGQVENIFVEVHPIQGSAPSLLSRVLKVLEEAGFLIHVARSPWSNIAHDVRPLTHAHRTYSLSVYGTRRRS